MEQHQQKSITFSGFNNQNLQCLISATELDQVLKSHGLPDTTLEQKFPEWLELSRLSKELHGFGKTFLIGNSTSEGRSFPLIGFEFGSEDPQAPVLILTGGVHGLERIGSQVVLSWMHLFSEMLLWDDLIKLSLEKMRIAFFPIVNPWGILKQTRSNPNGVDLMRNSPIEATENPTWLVAGHRISPRIPWYRGVENQLEPEALALIQFAKKEISNSRFALSIDFHSGFGTKDQLWFPYANSTQPFSHLTELHAFKNLFEKTHPHHFYEIEPQARHYTTHGDLWDFIYSEFLKLKNPEMTYLPLALEMGSWMWVKKNPLQILSALGPFNPMVPHRQKRILRRHNTLFDFLVRALPSSERWLPINSEQSRKHTEQALNLWYPDLSLEQQNAFLSSRESLNPARTEEDNE